MMCSRPECVQLRALRCGRRGFTLAEMLVALAVISIIVLGCGSVLTLATRAMNANTDGNSPASQAVLARAAADQITSDVRVATSITEQTATAITVTVPDRNADGSQETVRYAWSGVLGAPLTRQYNGGPAVAIADNVQGFDLRYITKTVGPAPVPQPVEGPEQVLISYDVTTTTEYGVKKTAWPAEYFKPTLPANAISWKITRIVLQLRRNGGATGVLSIQVKNVDSSKKPTGTALQAVDIDVTTIPTTATWVNVPFTNLSGLDPNNGLSVLLTSTRSTQNAFVRYKGGISPPTQNMLYCTSSNQGSSWTTPSGSSAAQYYVYGTVTTQP
jgi:prepilin-type N-terminal cleavage/methylation domain-containing protein